MNLTCALSSFLSGTDSRGTESGESAREVTKPRVRSNNLIKAPYDRKQLKTC